MNRLWLFAAAVLFSTGGAAIKGNSFTGWQVAGFRSLIAAIALAAMFPAARRRWTWRHLVAGLAYAAMLITFVTATKLTTAANAIFLQCTAPAYIAVLSPLLLKEPLRKSDLWLMCGVGIGMAMFFAASEPARSTAPDPQTGNIIALLSGVFWALTLIGLRWLGRIAHDDISLSTVVTGNLLAFVLALPFAMPLPEVSTRDVTILVYLGVVQIGVAYYCLTRAIRHVPAFEASTLLLVEPALNPAWTWLILGERPASLSIAGGAVILASTLANTWWVTTRARPCGEA